MTRSAYAMKQPYKASSVEWAYPLADPAATERLGRMIAEETAGAVTLKRAEGAVDVVPRGQIDEIASTGLSLMPEGLEQGLDVQALADLVAYVRSLQGGGPLPAPR